MKLKGARFESQRILQIHCISTSFFYFLAAFEPFLKVYIAEYAYKSIETDDFKKYFTDYFTKLGKSAEIADIDWNSWLFTPGLPVLKPK